MTIPGSASRQDLTKLKELVYQSEYLVVLTGAGISTASGIPDFRGTNGIYSKYPDAEKLARFDLYVSNSEIRKKAWISQLNSPIWKSKPNKAHLILAELEHKGILKALITQNIDGLHQMAGNSTQRVIEIHGTSRKASCLKCFKEYDMQEILSRVRKNDLDPKCENKISTVNGTKLCGGIIKAATISFGQPLDPEVMDSALRHTAKSDLFIAIGTSLVVYPAASLVPLAYQSGAQVVIINNEPTPYDDLATLIIRDDIAQALSVLGN
jgi:NAD-dependent deacetylase